MATNKIALLYRGCVLSCGKRRLRGAKDRARDQQGVYGGLLYNDVERSRREIQVLYILNNPTHRRRFSLHVVDDDLRVNGPSMYSAAGNDRELFRTPHFPFVARRDRAAKRLEALSKKDAETNDAPKLADVSKVDAPNVKVAAV